MVTGYTLFVCVRVRAQVVVSYLNLKVRAAVVDELQAGFCVFESAMDIFIHKYQGLWQSGACVQCYCLLSQVIIETAVGEESWSTLSKEN